MGGFQRTAAITVDLEWCPDPVLRDTVSLLDEHDIPATLFSTHDDGIVPTQHERGLHPNFSDNADEEAVLAELGETYPSARGIRSHGLQISSPLRQCYEPHSLVYESNYMQYLQTGSTPFWMLGEVVQFPIYFMDDFWLRSRKNETELPAVKRLLQGEGLKVFGFHPVHIYLNTPSIEYYNRHKKDYQEPTALRDNRSEQPGTRDLFVSLLESLSESDIQVKTLGVLYDSFTAAHPYDEIKL